MRGIVQSTDERSARSRSDRSIQTGVVVFTNSKTFTAMLDVGMVDYNGNPVYMVDVPFTPQTKPQINDTVTIMRTNSSPYSHVLGAGAQVGGANSGQVVSGTGGTGSTSAPTSRGQILYSTDGSTWMAETPVVSDDFGIILTEDDTGYMIVME